MRIIKKLNNSVVIASDDTGQEVVVMGKGIGCNYEMGSLLSQDDYERVFVLKDEQASSDVIRLSRDIPDVYFDISSRIIAYAKETLQVELNEHIYVALTDHIYFAVQRLQQNVNIQNRLFWEVKRFYPEEFKVGKYGLNLLLEELNLVFPEEEAGNIAFHLVNAGQSSNTMSQSVKITGIIKDIMNIVSYQFGMTLDHDSLNYSRFVTHLQYFAQRLLDNISMESDDGFLYEQVQTTYVKEFECAVRIYKYIEKNYQRTISNSEMIYLTVHIHRVVNRA